jgi:hypothetical protein
LTRPQRSKPGPLIGIWRGDGKTIAALAHSPTENASSGPLIDSELNHFEEWPEVAARFRLTEDDEYFSVARGRVLLRRKTGEGIMVHTGLLDRTRPNIPVYATAGASKMMLAGSIFANQTSLPRSRFRELKPEQPIVIGDVRIAAHAVDHSIFDCIAILIEADGKSILYTGDLRLHVRMPNSIAYLRRIFLLVKDR